MITTSPTETETTLRRAVGDAAALLDEHAFDWRDKIDTETLDIGDPRQCILGQLYGWFEGKRVLYGSENAVDISDAFCNDETLPYWLEELSA